MTETTEKTPEQTILRRDERRRQMIETAERTSGKHYRIHCEHKDKRHKEQIRDTKTGDRENIGDTRKDDREQQGHQNRLYASKTPGQILE